jgi:CHAT domain-containing protein
MPSTPGYRDLPLAEDEGYRVKYILGEKIQAEYVDNIDVEVMCQKLQTRSIVHCICHATSQTDPSKSSLLLKDGSLTVARMARIKIDPGAVAYLSACSTALSEAESLEDEQISLSTAFQVAGFAGVVGCLWKADDDASFHMAKSFYECLEGQTTRAAQAFHRASLDLRMKYPEEPSIWAPYIYTGA